MDRSSKVLYYNAIADMDPLRKSRSIMVSAFNSCLFGVLPSLFTSLYLFEEAGHDALPTQFHDDIIDIKYFLRFYCSSVPHI